MGVYVAYLGALPSSREKKRLHMLPPLGDISAITGIMSYADQGDQLRRKSHVVGQRWAREVLRKHLCSILSNSSHATWTFTSLASCQEKFLIAWERCRSYNTCTWTRMSSPVGVILEKFRAGAERRRMSGHARLVT